VKLPDAVEDTVRELAEEGKSFSATVTRLLEAGARAGGERRPSWVGAGEGPIDLGRRAEDYLHNLA
jgi:uncharacterized Ntn-hydrolase superfamily protein